MKREDVRMGQRVRIIEGWGYNPYDPIDFKRSDGTVEGIVAAKHEHPGTVYLALVGSQRLASAAIAGLEKVTQ